MRRWIGSVVVVAMLLGGCGTGAHGGRETQSGDAAEIRQQDGGSPLPIPVPEAVQDQDAGPGGLTQGKPPEMPPPASFDPAAETPAPGEPVYGPPLPPPEPSPAAAANPPPPPPTPAPATPQSSTSAAAAKAQKTGAAARKKSRDQSAEQQLTGKQSSRSGTIGKTTSLTELRRKYEGSFIFQGKTDRKQIALTFDDAPDTQYTPQVLDILKRYKVKATFFVVGYRAAEHPEVVKRIVREGHIIGNHSYGHAQLKKLPQSKFIREIEKSEQVLSPLAGYTPRLVRPPYGAVNEDELSWLKDNGYLTVNWNVDPEDWRGHSKDMVLKRTLDAAGPGAIILMHSATGDGGSLQGTVDALPDVIETLRGKGYELVPLTELLQTKKSK